jgi:hypothetical protein
MPMTTIHILTNVRTSNYTETITGELKWTQVSEHQYGPQFSGISFMGQNNKPINLVRK